MDTLISSDPSFVSALDDLRYLVKLRKVLDSEVIKYYALTLTNKVEEIRKR